MSFHEDLRMAVKDDARRAGERDRLFLEARRARVPRHPRAGPVAPVRRLARAPVSRLVGLLFHRAPA
jgi:hypothetical protein